MKAIKNSGLHTDVFPLSDQPGNDSSSINSQKMRLMAERGVQPDQELLQKMMEEHHEFLASGGAGGKWKTLQVTDIVIGFYEFEYQGTAQQANFEKMNLTKIELKNMEFPFSNFCGVFAPSINFESANLSYSLFTDSTLLEASFQNSRLRNVDFSRSDLSGVDFSGADLSGADFENCILKNANFEGARFTTARFPGANLQNIKW